MVKKINKSLQPSKDQNKLEKENQKYLFAEKISHIKILGSGCAKCNNLEENVKTALKNLDLTINVEHITDFKEIASYGIMTTPALVINETIVSYGKVIKAEEVEKMIKE